MTTRADLAAALRAHWLAVVTFLLLAVIHTWPMATNPGVLSRNDNGDTQLNEWIMAWVVHQLPRDPLRLFHANIFYPAKDTLAFNISLLLGFALTDLATYALVYSWTRDRPGALVAGSLFAFNTHTLTRIAHIQGIHAYGLPLALLFTDRLISDPRPATAVWLAVSMALMAYTSGYLVVFAAVMIAVALVARIADWRQRPRAVLSAFLIATAVTSVLVLPIAIPYRRVAIEQNMIRSIESVTDYSATLTGYIAAAGRVHFSTWSSRFFANPVDSFFPGVVAILLTAIAVWYATRAGAERTRVVMIVAIGLTGFILSLGLRTPLYGWLYAVFPPMRGLRAAARFGNLFPLAMAILAGFGLAALRRAGPARWITPAAVAAIVLVNVEALRAPFEYRRFEGISRVYDVLAREPGPVVLAETAFYPPHAVFANAEYGSIPRRTGGR